MCGPPGCGKSTWVREHMALNDVWISRDAVRFSIVREDEDYFSHEEEVFNTFIDFINQEVEDPEIEHIYIDATHVNYKSRHKVLSRVHMNNVIEVNLVYFSVPLAACLERNGKRSGRERVPDAAVANLYDAMAYPTENEIYNHIYLVEENGITMEV